MTIEEKIEKHFSRRSLKYTLSEDHIPIPCDDLHEWGVWFGTPGNRIVRQDELGPFFISTVFLGLDHNWSGRGMPLLFETMVFGVDLSWSAAEGWRWGRGDECYCRRYRTWNEALAGHMKCLRDPRMPVDWVATILHDWWWKVKWKVK